MHQDVISYAGIGLGPTVSYMGTQLPPKRGTAPPRNFQPMSISLYIVVKRLYIWIRMPLMLLFYLVGDHSNHFQVATRISYHHYDNYYNCFMALCTGVGLLE